MCPLAGTGSSTTDLIRQYWAGPFVSVVVAICTCACCYVRGKILREEQGEKEKGREVEKGRGRETVVRGKN